MNFSTYSERFIDKAIAEGLTPAEVENCLNYAKKLFDNSVPVIYNTTHFSKLVGVKKAYIKRSVMYTKSFYRNFEIAKRSGKSRTISEPLPNLKLIQNFILNEILNNIKVSAFAKAYKRRSTLIENVRYHTNQNIVITIDIRDFFGSIKKSDVERIFLNFGYSDLLADLLSKLCTLNDSLPQGAPTSPSLSNIYMKPFDSVVADFCLSRNIRYTRYADDITISGDFDIEEALEFIKSKLTVMNLTIHPDKFKVMHQGLQQKVTGIVVNNKIQAPRKDRNKLRQTLHYIKKFGIDNHIQHMKIIERNYLYHLYGKVSFIVYLNPKDDEFLSYKEYLKGLIGEIK